MMKAAIRNRILARRDALSGKERVELSEMICQNVIRLPEVVRAKTIAAYIAKGSEADARKIIEHCIAEGKTILVPSTNDHIEMVRFLGFDKLAPAKFGILEPNEKIPGPEPEVVLVPGIAFGLCMHRIGYGKGYYDAYLKKTKAHRIGLCYDFQLFDRLPSHELDERMDKIVTEKRIIAAKS